MQILQENQEQWIAEKEYENLQSNVRQIICGQMSIYLRKDKNIGKLSSNDKYKNGKNSSWQLVNTSIRDKEDQTFWGPEYSNLRLSL